MGQVPQLEMEGLARGARPGTPLITPSPFLQVLLGRRNTAALRDQIEVVEIKRPVGLGRLAY